MVAEVLSMAKRVRRRLAGAPREAREPSVVTVDPKQLEMLIAQIRGVAKSVHSFKALADKWLSANSARLVAPDNEWRHIRHLQALWAMTEEELTVPVARGHLSGLLKPNGPLSATTVNKVRATGKKVIDQAIESKLWTGLNPFAGAKRQKEQRKKRKGLTVPQLRLLLPHLRPDRRRLTKCAFFFGMRPGELLGLRKDAVNLERKAILVCRSHSRDRTKTGTEREIPIPEEVLGDIREAIEASPSAYVFPRPDGRRQRRDTKLTRVLRTAMVKAGLVTGWRYSCRRKGCGFKEERTTLEGLSCPRCSFRLWAQGIPLNVTFYGLRHSAATQHRQAGADALAVKMVLGHAARDETDDTYTHYTEEFVRMEMNKLSLENEKAPRAGTREASEERRKGFEPSTPSLGSFGSTVADQSADGFGPPVFESLLGVADVARLLGCSTHSVYRLAARGKIRDVRIGSAIRFTPASVRAFIAQGGAK